jgi:hypothetical protein
MPFKNAEHDGLHWLECATFAREDWLLHAFSTRHGGVSRGVGLGLNLGFTGSDYRARVEENRRRFAQAIHAQDFNLASLRQVHSTNIFIVTPGEAGEIRYFPSGSNASLELGGHLPTGDALITNRPDLLLSVRTADCLPILIVDPRQRAVAAVHAGWRGVLGQLAAKVVGVMRATFNSEPGTLIAAIGPGVRACCYGVGEEVVAAFHGRFVDSDKFIRPVPATDPAAAATAPHPLQFLSPYPPGHVPAKGPAACLDLVTAVQQQLCEAGLKPARIHDAALCTSCRTDLFFSHRKEGPRTGRMMAVIGIRRR